MIQSTEETIWPKRGLSRVLLAVAAIILLLAAGWAVGRMSAPDPFPGQGSAEAGFARDMQVHHAQAVQMSMIVRDQTDDEQIRRLAYDIARTQQQQAGQMHGWLTVWGLPQASSQPAMAWMEEGTGQPHTEHGMMPGMATAAEINRLESAQGVVAERLYLQLMIPHHEAGIVMTDAILERSNNPAVTNLARAMRKAQQAEIQYMSELLEAR